MTITTTVEELRIYQDKIKKWSDLRFSVMCEILQDRHRYSTWDEIASELAKKDREFREIEPMPTIIPKV